MISLTQNARKSKWLRQLALKFLCPSFSIPRRRLSVFTPAFYPVHMHMTYEQAIDFWYSRINYEQLPPQPADLKLDRMKALLQLLGNPQERLPIIHVAGSKGKGSTSAMLASVLRRTGYRAGLFTSPHLCRVEERIQVDGEPITPGELAGLLTQIRNTLANSEQAHQRADAPRSPLTTHHSPTFFEIATALGFLHFCRNQVDVAVIEVGLGGRFDSTNVCLPMVSLITSISFDHTQQLGNRLASIAMEKAGIVKSGRPAISGATVPEAAEVIERICQERQSPLQQLGRDFHYEYEPCWIGAAVPCKPRVKVLTPDRVWPWMELGLLGEHQAANAAVAVACIEQLRQQGWNIDDAAVADGLANVSWPARLEIIGRKPLVVLDCAHNVASVQALVDTLRSSFPPSRRLLIFAGSSDKDVSGMFRVLLPYFDHAFLTCHRNTARSVPAEQLARLCQDHGGVPHTVCSSPVDALEAARALAQADDLICITGSVYLAGELRPLLVGSTLAPA